MAQTSGNVVKKAIQIDAGNSVRTVKSLKEEIKELRDELLNLEQGTEEYDEVQQKLTEDVEDLNEVMSAHKDKAKALEGSYNDLQNQLKELKAAWKATNDEAERDVLGQKINDLNNQLKEMDASVGDFHRNVGNYQSAWEGLTGVMDKSEKITDDLEKGVKAFGTALGLSEKEVNELSKGLKKLKDAFKIAKDITNTQKATQDLATAEKTATAAGTTLATSQKATGAAAGVMAAGEKTATVATNGLSVAMRGLKAALVSTGIGALIVLFGELVNMLDKTAKKTKLNVQTAVSEILRVMNLFDASNEVKRREDEHDLAMMEARNEDERAILEKRLEYAKEYVKKYREEVWEPERENWENYLKEFNKLSKRKQKQLLEDENSQYYKEQKIYIDAAKALNKLQDEAQDAKWTIEVFDEKQKHVSKSVTEELKKWSELVQDPKFREAWTSIFNVEPKEGQSPTDVLREQYKEALKLAKAWNMETTEIDKFFTEAINESEEMWKSILDMENRIYDEGLTPVKRLEKEKAEWLEVYRRWGQDTVNLVKYYDDKIKKQVEEDQKEAQDKVLEQAEEFLNQVDATLSSNEKLDALFNPISMSDTASGEIQGEMDDLQRLYDTQMQYLNGLLESADLTEEAYEGVEQRILELTVTFNNQMKALKAEQDYQGKNFAILTKKQVANWQLMEQAASSFSEVFQSLGLENSVAYKGFASAQAIISAILAANRVLAEEPGEMWIKMAAAGATLAAGLANVAAIWMVDPSGSNAGSVNPQMDMAQATPVIGASQPISYTRNVTSAAEEDELNRPIWVSVEDISSGLDRQVKVVDASSF